MTESARYSFLQTNKKTEKGRSDSITQFFQVVVQLPEEPVNFDDAERILDNLAIPGTLSSFIYRISASIMAPSASSDDVITVFFPFFIKIIAIISTGLDRITATAERANLTDKVIINLIN